MPAYCIKMCSTTIGKDITGLALKNRMQLKYVRNLKEKNGISFWKHTKKIWQNSPPYL